MKLRFRPNKNQIDLIRPFHYTEQTMCRRRSAIKAAFLSLFCLLASGIATLSSAQMSEAQLEAELQYITSLTYQGFPDLAEKYMKRKNIPRAKLKLIEIRLLTSQKKFDEAKAVVAKEPEGTQATMTLLLAIADGYYMWGMYPEAQEIYNEFFKRYGTNPPEGLRQFYLESSYKYAQMLLMMGSEKEAVKAYEFMLSAIDKNDEAQKPVMRQTMSELAELAVKVGERTKDNTLLDRAFKLAEDIQWGGIDLWFGKAVVTMAHVFMAKGDTERAIGVLKDKSTLEILTQLDEALQQEDPALMRYSPMAECRYLVGSLREKQGDEKAAAGDATAAVNFYAKALNSYYLAFVKYPTSPWAPEGGRSADRIKKTLEVEYGKTIQMPAIDMRPVVEAQFRQARTQFLNRDFENAAKTYEEILGVFPEEEQSIPAIGRLAECYISLKEFERADVVVSYLAERFGHHETLDTPAGDALLKIADLFETAQKPEEAQDIYRTFFDNFSKHPRVPVQLFRFGLQAFDSGDYEGAIGYYQRVIKDFPKSHVLQSCYSSLARAYGRLDDIDKELEVLLGYIKELPASPRYVSTRYRIADAYRKKATNDLQKSDPAAYNKLLATAIGEYTKIEKIADDSKYGISAKDKKSNQDVKALALFRRGYCYARLKSEDAAKQKSYQVGALKIYKQFFETYPDHEQAPMVLSSMSTLYFMLGAAKQADDIMTILRDKYPESQQAKDALYTRIKILMELGNTEEALAAAGEMMQTPENFHMFQIMKVGELLNDNEVYDQAYAAFKIVVEKAEDDFSKQKSLYGLGQACTGTERHDEAVDALEKLLSLYPNTFLGIDASFALARSYGELGANEDDKDKRFTLFNNAMKAIKKIIRLAGKDKGMRARADYELAIIQLNWANYDPERKNDAIASFQRMLILGDPRAPGVRKWFEKSLLACIPLLEERGDPQSLKDIVTSCSTYLRFIRDGEGAKVASRSRNKAKAKLLTSGESLDDVELDFEDALPEETAEESEPVEGTAEGDAEPAADDAEEPAAPAAEEAAPAEATEQAAAENGGAE